VKPSERTAFDDLAFLVFEGKLVKEFLSVCAFGAHPFEDQEEQGGDGEGFVET
jgi:hypothetical protein